MPISTLANRRAFHFDKETELRDGRLAAISVNTIEPPIPFLANTFDLFKVIVCPLAYTGWVAGTAEWAVTLEASATQGGTYVAIDSLKINGANPKPLEMAVSGGEIEQAVPGAKFLRVNATKTGTPGALSYSAFLSPEVK